jgi:hypothetical protein
VALRWPAAAGGRFATGMATVAAGPEWSRRARHATATPRTAGKGPGLL